LKWFFHHERPQIALQAFKIEGAGFLAMLPNLHTGVEKVVLPNI